MNGDATFARWLVQLINSPVRAHWSKELRQDAAMFTRGYGPRRPGAPPTPVIPYPVEPLTDAEMGEIVALAHGLRGGRLEPLVSGKLMLWTHQGRLRVQPMLWEMPAACDRFLWRVYDVLSSFDIRVKFCERAGCGRAFIGKKRQAYCRPAHAVPVAARGGKYRQEHRAELAERARARRQAAKKAREERRRQAREKRRRAG